jgi:hypothetical protein
MKLTLEINKEKYVIDNPNIDPLEAQLDVNQLESLWEALKSKIKVDTDQETL